MELITNQLLDQLVHHQPGPCISLYMPTYRKSPDSLQNPIRFQNLLKQAKTQLSQSNFVNHQIKVALDQAATSYDQPDNWMHQRFGLAMFVSADVQLFIRSPLKFSEKVVVNHHFYVKPLLPLLTSNGKFYILTLSQADIKLYQATRDSIDKVYLKDIPRSLQDTVDPDDLRSHLQFHTRSSSTTGQRQAMYHGQGGASDKNVKNLIEQFLNQVASGVDQLLINQKAPLVLSGVEYLTNLYKTKSRYSRITNGTVDGNPERSTKAAIHQSAWKIVRPIFKQAEKEALDEFGSLQQNGKTSKSLQEILPAAHSGRVKNLFALRDHTIWGMFDPDSNTLAITPTNQPGTDDLMNLATIYTLIAGGQVYSLKPKEMIPATPLAAVYRY